MVGIFGVVLVYALSPGPVALLEDWIPSFDREWMDTHAWYGFYKPMGWLSTNWEPADKFYGWYFSLFVGVDLAGR